MSEEKVELSTNVNNERIEELKALFPEAFSEGKIDFSKLREVLGDFFDDKPERYAFNWAGKRKAIRLIQTQTRSTLIPVPEASIDFENTENLYIEGDNLEVLKNLYKSYAGCIKLIYIDPPFNTGKEFIYPDNYSDPLENYLLLTGQKDGNGNLLTSNPETNGRFHSFWLSMMYPRLFFARQLLSEDGVIFVSINDKELHNLILLMNEIFGEENYIATLIWDKGHSAQAGIFKVYHEYILVYARNKQLIDTPASNNDELFEAGAIKRESRRHSLQEFTFPAGVRFDAPDGTELTGSWGGVEKVYLVSGRMVCESGRTKYPVTLKAAFTQMYQMRDYFNGSRENLVDSRGQKIVEFYFTSSGKLKVVKKRGVFTPDTTLSEYGTQSSASNDLAELFDMTESPIDNPKPPRMIKDFISWFTEADDIILDFFAGSCTTAHAVLELNREDGGNRRFIMVQLPEPTPKDSAARKAGYNTISDIGQERIRRVIQKMKVNQKPGEDLGFKVFKLAESNFRQWKESEEHDSEKLTRQLQLFEDPLLPGWKPLDVIYEVALKEGFSLNCKINRVSEITFNEVYQVIDQEKDQSFFICLDEAISEEILKTKAINLTKDTLFICRDKALTDNVLLNLSFRCKVKNL